MLTKFLRAHQREGLQFLFDCVTGQKSYEGQGWCVKAFLGISDDRQRGINGITSYISRSSASVGMLC